MIKVCNTQYSIFKCSNKWNFVINVFCKFFSHMWKCLKAHQLNIIKIIKKDYKIKARERYQSLSKEEEKKAAIWW